MGNDNSRYITELSDDSSESESDYFLESRPSKLNNIQFATPSSTLHMENDVTSPSYVEGEDGVDIDIIQIGLTPELVEDLTVDASVKDYKFPKPEAVLTTEKVHEIEKDLDDYEIVSLVYLLHEDARYALQELTLLLNGARKSLIYDWANNEDNAGKPWQKKLIEALCIIKNYKVLKALGYQKQDLIADFLPQRVKTLTLMNKVKKAIYLICEKLTKQRSEEFLKKVKEQFDEQNLVFDSYDSEFLELYFLKWETINFISLTDMSNIKRVLKIMDEDYLYDMLYAAFSEEAPSAMETERRPVTQTRKLQSRPSTSTDTQQLRHYPQDNYQFLFPCSSQRNSQSPRSSMDQDNVNNTSLTLDDNRYHIDPENPGILLIINQEHFYTELDERFKDLLPDDLSIKLEAREGTEKDRNALENAFRKFGFKIITATNLRHEDMMAKIEEVVNSVRNESSLFVCIMSHGDKGVVYGSNSCKVKVTKIQELMCRTNKKNLASKPKILILQSCQGKECQKVDESSDEEAEQGAYAITTDGPKSVPKTVDMFTFWATVPGYAAIRNKRTGSWFIQTLCEKIVELSDRHHFADICTRILNSVSGREWVVQECGKNAMTPLVESTFRKDFHFPPMRDVENSSE